MALIPRPASAPISPCENGLVGRPVVMLGEATALVGSNGAARLTSGTPVCQPCGTDSPPACIALAICANPCLILSHQPLLHALQRARAGPARAAAARAHEHTSGRAAQHAHVVR